MLNWAHKHGVNLFLIEPGKPNQNAYIVEFNGRFRDECLNEHWFINLPQAKIIIEAWRRQYNEERPKKVLGGLEQNARFLNRAFASQSFVFTASFSPETVSHFSEDALTPKAYAGLLAQNMNKLSTKDSKPKCYS